MPAQTYELALTGFSFPNTLTNDKANFRFVVDLRYLDKENKFASESVVMPGLDTFWECATDKSTEPNFVRAANGATFDMAKIDDWDQLVLVFRGTGVHSLQVKVFDVNRKDAWDTIKENIGPIVEALIGKLKGAVPGLPSLIGDSLGSAAEDVQSYLLRKMAGGAETVLFKGSAALPQPNANAPVAIKIAGDGSKGKYTADFVLTLLS